MVSTQNNLNLMKCICLFLILLGLSLYFKNINSSVGAIRSYFLLGFTFLFLIFGISFSKYEYTAYKKYFSSFILKFVVYAAAYLTFSSIVILIAVFTTKNNLKFSTNVAAVINDTKFLFTNFWFIPTGLILLLAMPFLDKMLKKINYSAVLFMSIILTIVINEVIAPIIPNNVLYLRDVFSSMRYILFYGLFILIGLSYKKLLEITEKNKTIIIFFIFICLIIIAACLIIYGYSYNLIKHFYPPSFFLTIYHLLVLTLFFMILPKLSAFANSLSDKKFIKFTLDYYLEIIFIAPVLLYLISLLFYALKVTDFLNKYFIIGFLTYFLCPLLILILAYFIKNLIKKIIKTKKATN